MLADTSLPKNYNFKDYVNEGYENFSRDNIDNLSVLRCEGEEGYRFFIKDKGAICKFSMNMKSESNFSLFKVKKFISTDKGNFEDTDDMRQDINDHWIWINLNDTYEFRAHLHFIFLNNNSNKWEYVYSINYEDESLSKEGYRQLEERKNILLFSLISIVIFSIISSVVNIKRITEKHNKKE